MNLVTGAIKAARDFYDEKTYYHAMREKKHLKIICGELKIIIILTQKHIG